LHIAVIVASIAQFRCAWVSCRRQWITIISRKKPIAICILITHVAYAVIIKVCLVFIGRIRTIVGFVIDSVPIPVLIETIRNTILI
jgi:hypothetical protein